MTLTKEQIDGIEKHVKEFDELWPYQADDMLELIRGYRAYLAEVEEHEQSIKFLHNIGADGGPAEEYHISRLSALKKGAE